MPHLSAPAFRQNRSRCTALAAALALVAGFSVSGPARLAAQPGDSTEYEIPGLAIGTWQSHLSYRNALSVAACANYTAYGTDASVLLRDHATGELRPLDKTGALEQADVALVACNPYTPGELLVAYRDGAVQVLDDGERPRHYNVEIANAALIGRRDFRRVTFVSAELALFSMDFGLLLYDPVRDVFREDIRTSTPVNDAVVSEAGDLYLASPQGLRVLRDFATVPNLRDTTRYEPLNAAVLGIPADSAQACTALAAWRGDVYAAVGGNIYVVSGRGDRARAIRSTRGYVVRTLFGGPEHLIATLDCSCGFGDLLLASADGETFADMRGGCEYAEILAAVESPDGTVAVADRYAPTGFNHYERVGAACAKSSVNSPWSNRVYGLDVREGVVAVAPGGITVQSDYRFNQDGVFVRAADGTWSNYNLTNTTAFAGAGNPDGLDPRDVLSVKLDADGGLWAAAYLDGLIYVDEDGGSALYNETNSTLGNATGDEARTRVAAVDFDAAGNLWIAQSNTGRGLSVRTPEGAFYSYDLSGCARGMFRDLRVERESGTVWVIDSDNGLVAFRPGEDLAATQDVDCYRFTTGNGLPTNEVRAIAIDRQATVWVGTSDGLRSLPCGGLPSFEDVTCAAPGAAFRQDGILGYLFDDELVRAIAVDGGNRKWVGTNNGLFLISPNADAQLRIYGERDSPLLSDEVTALAFDDATGVLWVGTAAGLISLQTESTGAERYVHSGVEVYPQPVTPDYEGPIAIRGLAADANVKITDAAGRLVYETDAIGGTATWNGRDYTGRRPASGVYFVWATAGAVAGGGAQGKPDAVVAKIALVR